jgi:hypothetical protein
MTASMKTIINSQDAKLKEINRIKEEKTKQKKENDKKFTTKKAVYADKLSEVLMKRIESLARINKDEKQLNYYLREEAKQLKKQNESLCESLKGLHTTNQEQLEKIAILTEAVNDNKTEESYSFPAAGYNYYFVVLLLILF